MVDYTPERNSVAQKPETKFRQGRVLPFLKTLRNTAYFPIQQVSIRGTPDYILCVRGRFVGLELKRSQEADTSKLQQFNLDWIKRVGGVAIKAYPENWDLVKGVLRSMDAGETV